MTNNTARFTAPNIAAILRALPDTDGTYHDVIRQVSEYGVALSPTTLGKWVSKGRSDIKANRRQTAYARFALKYDQLKRENCAADANRNREFDLALQILERTCDCGKEKITFPDGASPTPVGSARTSRTKEEDRPEANQAQDRSNTAPAARINPINPYASRYTRARAVPHNRRPEATHEPARRLN